MSSISGIEMSPVTRSCVIGHTEARQFLGDTKYGDLLERIGESAEHYRLYARWEAKPDGTFDGLYHLREFYEFNGCIIVAERGVDGTVRQHSLGLPESAWAIEAQRWKNHRREQKAKEQPAEPVKLAFKAKWGLD